MYSFVVLTCWCTVVHLMISCIWSGPAVITKIEQEKLSTVLTPEMQILVNIFEKYGFKDRLRLVGGAVRDLLSGQIPTDVDLATSVTLEEMKEIFRAENIPMLNNKTEKHGTIMLRINHKQTFESSKFRLPNRSTLLALFLIIVLPSMSVCASFYPPVFGSKFHSYSDVPISVLRIEKWTDNKVEIVSYIQDWLQDATRRDFTINTLYLDFEGNLYDYFNGYEHLKNGRVLFIDNPGQRIRENSLLILRYFRLFGKISKDPSNHDREILQAIRDNAATLDKVHGQRMWTELQGILNCDFVNELVKTMLELGLAQYIGLSSTPDVGYFDFACRNRGKYSFEPLTLIGSLLNRKSELTKFRKRMNLSFLSSLHAYVIVELKNATIPDSDEECFKFFQRKLVFSNLRNVDAERQVIIEFLKLIDREAVLKRFSEWTMPDFTLDRNVLMANGITNQDQVKQIIDVLKQRWIDNDFVIDNNLIIEVANQFKKNYTENN